MTAPADQMKLAVLRAMPLPPAWVTSKQVYALMDQYSRNTIKQALLELSRDGLVAKFGPIDDPAFRRMDVRDSDTNPEQSITRAAAALAVKKYRRDLAAWKGRP